MDALDMLLIVPRGCRLTRTASRTTSRTFLPTASAALLPPAGNGTFPVARWMGVGTQQPDFAEFYRGAADECLRTVMVAAGNQDTAQELVDEAFARAWASWRTVSRHPAPKAWVVRTALNLGISRWRRRRREISVPDPARITDPAAAEPGAVADPRIMAALLRLPARQREVVALRLILDLDTARTAEVLGIAPGTVMAHMGRAMAALRHDLQPQLQQENQS